MNSKEYREMMARKGRRRGNPTAGPNKTEQAFKVWRERPHPLDKNKQQIHFLIYEPIKLRIGPPGSRCWYTPDYMEMPEYDGRTILWDVKARGKSGKPRVEDDALVKIKAAADKYGDFFSFAITWPNGNGGWDERWF